MKNNLKTDTLFTRYHNEMAVSLYRILKQMENGKKYTATELEQQLSANFHPSLEDLKYDLSILFFEEEDGYIQPKSYYWDESLPFSLPSLPPGLAEKRWLKTMLTNEYVSFLFSPDLRQKLLEQLKDIRPFPLDTCRVRFQDDTRKEPLHTALIHFRQGIQRQKKIVLTLRNGLQQTVLPFRLELNARTGRLSYWVSKDGADFQRLPVRQVTTVTLLAEKAPDLHSAFEAFLQQQKREVQLKVTPQRNAVERCFALFASYYKKARYNEETNDYVLQITYYSFDEKEVLNNIISLGKNALVLGPENIRQQIVRRLQQIVAAYQER